MRYLNPIILTLFSFTFLYSSDSGKIGIYVTPDLESDPYYNVSYSAALDTLSGHADTVWLLTSWKEIETADNVFDWTLLDSQVNKAVSRGFSVGLRLQVVLCGNDANHNFVAISRIPSWCNQDMGSDEFASRSARFFAAATARYKGKAKYIAIANTMNKYFEAVASSQWTGFKSAFPGIVSAVKAADPEVKVMCDITTGDDFWTQRDTLLKKYIDYFKTTDIDVIGILFYFIAGAYYDNDFANKFNITTIEKDLEIIYNMGGGKPLYIIEGSCFSKNPNTGNSMTAVQSNYVDMLLTTVTSKSYIMGNSWWQMYDAKDLPSVPWDVKATFGLFDANGAPKPSWSTWKSFAVSTSVVTVTSAPLPVESNFLQNARGYPNPARIGNGTGSVFKIAGLPAGCFVDVYNNSGELVRTLSEQEQSLSGAIEWDGKNSSGEQVSQGLYAFLIRAPGGLRKVIKAGVLK